MNFSRIICTNFRQGHTSGFWGAGLCGWNCRHTFFAVFPELGDPPAWTRDQLEELKRFASVTGGRVDSARTNTAKFSRRQAGKATALSQEYHTEWLKSINARSTSLNTVAKYYDARYNNTEEYRLLMQYANSVKSGWLSPLTGFDLCQETHNRIQTELVGKAAADGTVITGHTIHFMERLFGTLVDPKKLKEDHEIVRRSGTDFWKISDAITNPVMPSKKVTDKLGRTSIIFFGKYAQVSMNEKGELIQCQPKERRN